MRNVPKCAEFKSEGTEKPARVLLCPALLSWDCWGERQRGRSEQKTQGFVTGVGTWNGRVWFACLLPSHGRPGFQESSAAMQQAKS